jgi:TPR repeat protein
MTLTRVKRTIISAIVSGIVLSSNAYANETEVTNDLPVSFIEVFNSQMDNPLVMVYEAERQYRLGDKSKSLSWYLRASKFMSEPAIANAKWMILNNEGVFENRLEVVDFLSYYGTSNGETPGDLYAQLYMGDLHSGASCVWSEYRENMHPGNCSDSDTLVTSKDSEKAYYWYTSASEQGSARAFYHVGLMDALGFGASRNVAKAVRMLERVAETDHANSAHILGKIFKTGYWMTQDQAVASAWLQKAVDLNHTGAMLDLADNYRRGLGVKIENDAEGASQAIRLYDMVNDSLLSTKKEKATAIFEKGLLQLTRHSVSDPIEGVTNLKRAIEISDSEAVEIEVSALMKLASLATKQSYKEALYLYQRAESRLDTLDDRAHRVHASLYQSVAQIYSKGGMGVEKDLHQFSVYMKKYHAVKAKQSLTIPSKTELFGYSAFTF